MSGSQEILEAILESQKDFIGKRQALSAARESPLEIDREGNIQDYYGEEEIAIEILLQRFYERTGDPGLRYSQKYLHKEDLKLPNAVELPKRKPGLVEKISNFFNSFL